MYIAQSAQPVEYRAKENNFQWAFTELHAVKMQLQLISQVFHITQR